MSPHTRPVSISTLANEENVSSEFLEQIFYKLKKADVIRSIRGPGGGFVLNRKPEQITVKDILAAVGEMGGITPCTLRRRTLCDRPDPCGAHEVWTGLQERIADYLGGITLKDIIDRNGSKYAPAIEAGNDFVI